jgi:uncharacterized membrane protein YraQ (UPF0718 family)
MNIALYGITAIALGISLYKSREKTLQALRKAWKSFENMLPQLLSILVIIGVLLALLTPAQISALIGAESGWIGTGIALALGAVTLIPAFVAFPLAAALLHNGAGIMQIAGFVSALMMVGIITLPLEFRYFGKKAALTRNAAALAFSVLVAFVMGVVLR